MVQLSNDYFTTVRSSAVATTLAAKPATAQHGHRGAVRFSVLGSIGIDVDGERASLARAQVRGLLALLVLNAGRALTLGSIIDALWGGAAPSTARAQVHAAVSAIRGRLPGLQAREILVSRGHGYQLIVAPQDVDLCLFDQHVRHAGRSHKAGDRQGAARHLRAALNLWRGEPLADASGWYVDSARNALSERRLMAVEDLANLDLRTERPAAVVAQLRPLVDAYPLRERLRALLMIALYRSGRQAEALGTFRVYQQLLVAQEGLDPGRDLTALMRRILRGEMPS